jgi:hypothetical protein
LKLNFCFGIYDLDVDPDEITKLVGLKPTHISRKVNRLTLKGGQRPSPSKAHGIIIQLSRVGGTRRALEATPRGADET